MGDTDANPSLYLYGPGDARIENSPYPTINDPHDVIIRIGYVGVCGSDVHFWTHGGIVAKVSNKNPIIMGHEASGTIHEVGAEVTSLKIGDRVAIEPGQPCRRCKNCKAGFYNLCPKMKFAADPPHSHGALVRYYKLPEDFCYKIPDSMGLGEAVLVEPTAVAVHVARLADIRAGQDVVVFGAGTVGLLCAAVAKAMGARKVISVDIIQSRLDFAQKFASTGTFLPAREDSAEESARKIIEQYDLDEGADVILEATGAAICIETGINVARRGATFIQAGLGASHISFPIVALSSKEIHMKGSFRYNAGDYESAMFFLESGKISVKELISSEEPFERATFAWEKTKRGEGIKNLIRGPAA